MNGYVEGEKLYKISVTSISFPDSKLQIDEYEVTHFTPKKIYLRKNGKGASRMHWRYEMEGFGDSPEGAIAGWMLDNQESVEAHQALIQQLQAQRSSILARWATYQAAESENNAE